MAKRKAKSPLVPVTSGKASPPLDYAGLLAAVGQAHQTAQRHAVQAINVALTLRNWLIGYYIVEYEQQGRDRAQYRKRLLETLARDLRKQQGRGFGRSNLFTFRQFYRCYPIVQSVIGQFALTRPFASTVPFPPFKRHARRVRPGRHEQSDLRLPVPARHADAGGAGPVSPADPAAA